MDHQELESGAGGGQGRGSAARIDMQGRVPLYHQIFLTLKNRIYSGMLGPGDPVPGEQELCGEFGVSRITAKRALNELADAGLVVRERGRGTRVVPHPPAQAVTASIEGWLENISRMGMSTEARVLDLSYVPSNGEIAAALDLETGTQVQRAERLRILDGEPMSYLVTYVPADIGRHYEREDLETTPLLHLLERAGVNVASARQTISATLADDYVASALDINPGAALIEVRRIVRDAGGRAVEYIRVLYRPDLYRYELSMKRVREKDGARWTTTLSSPAPNGAQEKREHSGKRQNNG